MDCGRRYYSRRNYRGENRAIQHFLTPPARIARDICKLRRPRQKLHPSITPNGRNFKEKNRSPNG
jgi:hypothetical protein